IAVIAPLMGLTGTVLGMIESFRVMAACGGGASVGLLAKGIWEALITTAAGLLVAIPAEIAYHYLEGRLDEISLAMKALVLPFKGGEDEI
ncbi:MAG: MotA/TolQ/ExbB proton channel family protein, partial [Syntrophales bacterium]|nr:MotA/TolQ/ExbB proton channel family protein [Syntrophales bacterium]